MEALLNYLAKYQFNGTIDSRKQTELEFHNERRKAVTEVQGNAKFYKAAKLSREYVQNWIRSHAPGKVFLDYACGNGGNAIRAAKAGAKLSIGIEISDTSVENCRRNAADLPNAYFVQADCENTGIPGGSIDVIICSGMLHHLDLNQAFPELCRILKPGGVVLGVEALGYNPLIQMYRNRTPEMRTEWEKEHILSYKELRLAAKFFTVQNVKHWHLFGILGAYAPSLFPLLTAIDKVVLTLPGIKLMSWMFTFELQKSQ